MKGLSYLAYLVACLACLGGSSYFVIAPDAGICCLHVRFLLRFIQCVPGYKKSPWVLTFAVTRLRFFEILPFPVTPIRAFILLASCTILYSAISCPVCVAALSAWFNLVISSCPYYYLLFGEALFKL